MNPIRAILDQNNVLYEIIHHEKQIRTAQEGADYFGIVPEVEVASI